jgi:hypothetical protein
MFFLSYGRASPQPSWEADRQVTRFFDGLSENVLTLVSRATGEEFGFIDRSMYAGSRWTPEFLHSLGTCQVLVAVAEAPCSTCRRCGTEWYGFTQRRVVCLRATVSTRQIAILRVIWARFPKVRIPPVVAQVQRFSPARLPVISLVVGYERYGVLVRCARTDAVAWAFRVVWGLVRPIADLHDSDWVEPREFRHEGLRDVFTRNPAGQWKLVP